MNMTTLSDIKEMILEEKDKLNKLGYNPVEVNTVKIVNATSFYTDATPSKNMIRVSSYFLDAPKDEIQATIMHEMIHMVPESGHGHGKEWQRIAAIVSFNYPQYRIKRVGSQLASSQNSYPLRAMASVCKRIHHHIVKCEKCGQEFHRTRESNLTLHPELYKCKCGGSLVRVF